MRRMHGITAAAVLTALLWSGAAGAAEVKYGPRLADVSAEPSPRLKMMVQQFGLSEAQKAAIKPMLEEEDRELRRVQEDTALWPVEKQQKRVRIIEQNRKRIAELFTPEQRRKYDELLEKGRAQRDAARAREDKQKERQRRAADPAVAPPKKLGLIPAE